MARPFTPMAERFWRHVRKTDGCWFWTGTRNGRGYGRLSLPGRGSSSVPAHRFSYELHTGQTVLPGVFVCHSCDTPACVRPDHLFLGTHTDNMRDAAAKTRTALGDKNGARKHPDRLRRGEKNARAKLTAADVVEIRRAYDAGEANQTALGRRFGVSQVLIGTVVRRTGWKHVP